MSDSTSDILSIMAFLGNFFIVDPAAWLFAGHGDVIDARRRADTYYEVHRTYAGAEFQIEEFVRQWALLQLLRKYKYPRAWLGDRIVIEESVKMGATEKQADISIKNGNSRTFLYVETKKRGGAEADFLEAERQLESYLASTHTATIGLVTNGDRVRTLRKKIDPNDFEYIPDLPSYGLDIRIRTQLVREMPQEASQTRSLGLKTLESRYERVLADCHNAARDVDGLHDDEALDEICKVLYAKIFDERTVSQSSVGTPFRFQVFGSSNASEVASNIRVLYEDARNSDINKFNQRIPNYERSRGVFKAQIRLSDAALFRVVERLQEFSLIDSSMDVKGRAFQTVLGPAIRAGMGQYFTPDPIVELAVRLLRPKANEMILDPFCGSGHFLTKSLQYVVDTQSKLIPQHALHEFKFFHLHGIEKSDRMVRIAMTDMMLHDDGHSNVRNTDALLSFDNYPDIMALGSNSEEDPEVFDIVMTNPPFGSIAKQEGLSMIGRFTLGFKRKSLPLEILGLERSFGFLKPGGRLAIVLPEHLMKGKNALFVRKWLYNVARVKAIFFFPEDAFTPFGAMVKTCLCIMQKLGLGQPPDSTAKTFLCEVENLGYDATGRFKPGSDLEAAAKAFEEWVRSEDADKKLQ